MLAFHLDEREGARYRGLIRPVVVCDRCGKFITHAGNVLYVMPELEPGRKEFLFQAKTYHVHKHCNRAFEAALGVPTSWIPLGDYLVNLMSNTEMVSDKTALQLLEKADSASRVYWKWRKERES